MTQPLINEQTERAILERVSKYTVGIAGNENTIIGTGTLVTNGEAKCILTAEHVIRGIDQTKLRFWSRPSGPLIEKAAKDTTKEDRGRLTTGDAFPIESIAFDLDADIAVIWLNPTFKAPASAEFFDLRKSFPVMSWPTDQLEGVSTMVFGFPVDNAQPLYTIENNTFCFLGCACFKSKYDTNINSEFWNRISNKYSPEKDFLLEYPPSELNIKPYGFSGCGIWIGVEGPPNSVWSPDPILIGVTHTYFPSLSLIAATKLPRIIHLEPKQPT